MCRDTTRMTLIQDGLAILTADGSVRMRGFTTGTTAAAAAKAAVLSLSINGPIVKVTVLTPAGIRICVPVIAFEGSGRCKKYAGDYPGDVTAGIEFLATATRQEEGLDLSFGEGIGRWERDTQRFRSGDPAVSLKVMEEINIAIQEGLFESGINGIKLIISAIEGAEISEKTLNSMVGVIGGISVLGTTGFVEPWDDHLEQTVNERVAGAEKVVLTTGRIGMRYARLLFPDHEVILAGSRLSGIVSHINKDFIICGLPALILKYINPHFLKGTGYFTVESFMADIRFFPLMESSLRSYKEKNPNVRVVVVNREGKIIGDSE